MQKLGYFIYASRPKTLIASIAPVLITSIYCYKFYSFNMIIFFCTIVASAMIQIMTNFINDLYDYRKGADTNNRVGPNRMVQKGYLSESDILYGIYSVFLFTLLIGCYLVSVGGIIILLIGFSAFLFAYLYTATRFSIAYNGLGEVFVFLYFGIIASLGTFYLQTFIYSSQVVLIGSIVGCLNVNLLVINNLRDLSSDRISKKKTLIVKFGEKFGKIEFIIMFVLAHIFLYFFSLELNDMVIFFSIIPLSCYGMFIIYKIIYDPVFINHSALPLFSLYIILFTTLLTYNLYL